ncbi:MAG TPA: flagellar biosynthetic protein FliR [Tepidisphaeraceae bacterium]|nr:flagellar biosynthetic protein FliR [Tepidisphaeraceae bacterium]
MLESLLSFVPTFVLVVFRLAGMMLYAPLFGSVRVPRRVRVALILVLAAGITPGIVPPRVLPDTPWGLAVGIGGEMAFGLAMGMVLSFVFVAVQWAGEIIGQQMGFNLGEVFDPQFGSQSSVIGDMYFMFTLVVFLLIGGHRSMIAGVRASFDALPLLSVGINHDILNLVLELFQAATILAIQLAAPVLITMLIVDLVLGLIGRTIPQMNVMSAALSIRAGLGILVIWFGLTLTAKVIRGELMQSMQNVRLGWTTAAQPVGPPR